MRAAVLTVALLLSSSVCWAQSAFDGQWNGMAGEENLTFTFMTDDMQRVTGSVAQQGGPTHKIDWGYVKGDLIVFKVMREFQGMDRPFVYIGQVEGQEIVFGRRPEDLTLGRLRELTAKRVK